MPETELTTDKAIQLLFWAYFLSQGDPYGQNKPLHYVHKIRPDWRLTDGMKTKLIESTQSAVIKLESLGRHKMPEHKLPGIRDEATYNVRDMDEILQGIYYPLTPRESVVDDMIVDMIYQDHKHIIVKGERPRKPTGLLAHELFDDPNLSHFCHFVLRGNELKVPEYNQMFQEMRDVLPRRLFGFYLDGRITRSMVEKIVIHHNRTHPGQEVELPQVH